MFQLLYQMSFSGFVQVIVKTYFPTRVCLLLSKMCLMKLRIPSCVVIYVVWFVFYSGECMIMWKKVQLLGFHLSILQLISMYLS